jgi:tRNA-guanine family transglycosylase
MTASNSDTCLKRAMMFVCLYNAELECQMVLGNTYHLENRPGSTLLRDLGGLSAFVNWRNGSLTDSGGFQMVSLLDLADISVRSKP